MIRALLALAVCGGLAGGLLMLFASPIHPPPQIAAPSE